MAESNNQARVSAPDPAPNQVCDSWNQVVQGVLAIVMFLGALAMVHYYAPKAAQAVPPDDLQNVPSATLVQANAP